MASQSDISLEEFKGSQRWINGFLLRYELSLRRSTTLFKLDDDKIIKRALTFKYFVDNIDFSKYQLSNILKSKIFGTPKNQILINLDEKKLKISTTSPI